MFPWPDRKTQMWYDHCHRVGQILVPNSACQSEVSLHRLLQELHRLCAHLAVFPVCRSASLPRVPLCCHVWKRAFALMYNTSLDPCFWYGCWQESVEEKLVPKDALSGITALTAQNKNDTSCILLVKWCQNLFTCAIVGFRNKNKKCLSLFKCDLLVWVNGAVIVLLCKY